MNFRRLPFQFNVTDPVEKRSELMRKFGTPDDNMLVTGPCESVLNAADSVSSPRFQHRLPEYFSDGQTMKSTNGADSVDSNKQQPRVRVIPIQIEGSSDSYPSRQRTKSGDTFYNPQRLVSDNDFRLRSNSGSNASATRPNYCKENLQAEETGSSRQTAPRVCNIPVVIEGKSDVSNVKPKSSSCINIPVQKKVSNPKVAQKPNGPCISKGKQPVVKADQAKTETVDPKEVSLQQVKAVLKEFQSYKEAVSKFTGNQSDKEYRYLDEMLTRCMLKLDDVETHGNEEVRKTRKAAVKEVQDCINDLEAKVQANVASANIENIQNGAIEAKEEIVEDASAQAAELGIESDQKETSEEVESPSRKDVEMAIDLATGEIEQKTKDELSTAESSTMEVSMANIETEGKELENETTVKVAVEKPVEIDLAKPSEVTVSDKTQSEQSSDIQPKEEVTDIGDNQPLEIGSRTEVSGIMETEVTDVPKEQVPIKTEMDELMPDLGNSYSEVELNSVDTGKSIQPETVLECGNSDATMKLVPSDCEISSKAEDNEPPCKSDMKSDHQAEEKMDCC